MEFFGAAIEEAQAANPNKQKGPRNLLELLPDNFSYREAVEVRLQAGMDEKGTQNMLNQWGYRNYIARIRNYIARITNYNYSKLKFRNDGTDTDKNY